ncbi:Leupaxin, partial [Galemys pyrenaicus]
ALLEELERSSLQDSGECSSPAPLPLHQRPRKEDKLAKASKVLSTQDATSPLSVQLVYTTEIQEPSVYSEIQEPQRSAVPPKTSAAAQLDELMTHLCEMQAQVAAKPDASKAHLADKKDHKDSLDSMLGGLQQDLQDLGIATVPKGHCASCRKPIAGKVGASDGGSETLLGLKEVQPRGMKTVPFPLPGMARGSHAPACHCCALVSPCPRHSAVLPDTSRLAGKAVTLLLSIRHGPLEHPGGSSQVLAQSWVLGTPLFLDHMAYVIHALGQVWHPEHFICTHCKKEIGSRPFFERSGAAYCPDDYHQLFSPRCAYCAAPILDKVLTAMDQTWHPEHFFCAHCGEVFGPEGFHEKDKKPYCRKDFLAMFSPKCGGCNRPVLENYLSAMDTVWHPECFVCGDCFTSFSTGSFFELDGRPFCELHYHHRQGTLCRGCGQPITGRCISAMGYKFHPEHFVCAFCLTQLSKGVFKEHNDKTYCQPCFLKLFSV